MNTSISAQELSSKFTTDIEELARDTDSARVSEAMLSYLEVCVRFHQYSPQNV